MKIRTEFVYPPIPIRQFDWTAIDDDIYDGAPDCHCPIGYGRTEAEAIADLKEQLYLATEAADLAPVTDDDGRDPDADCDEWQSYETDDNYFQQIHQSDKGIAERERGWDRGERDE